jgi:hypothetical protein
MNTTLLSTHPIPIDNHRKSAYAELGHEIRICLILEAKKDIEGQGRKEKNSYL